MMVCKVCGKAPHEILEYIQGAVDEGIATPAEYVRQEEGTFNRETELFYCTECYIRIGMPLGTA